MDRRSLLCAIGLGGAIAFRVAVAAPSSQVWRIGYLRRISFDPAAIEALRQGLRNLGYVEGQNLIIEERYADGDAGRLPGLVQELLRLNVQAFVVDGVSTVKAIQNAGTTTPVVFTVVADATGTGLVRSLNRPGGTVTGLTNFSLELGAKRLQLLNEVVPLRRIGFLYNSLNTSANVLDALRASARSLGVKLFLVEARAAAELPVAFATLNSERVDAFVIGNDGLFYQARVQVVGLAAQYRLPAMYTDSEFAVAGGLMSYGVSEMDNFRRSAVFIDKIFKGANPGDLAIEQPTKFELVINLKTANSLGIVIPQSVLLRADEVIR